MKLAIRPFKRTEYTDWKKLWEDYMSVSPDWDRGTTRRNWRHFFDLKQNYRMLAVYDGKTPVGFMGTIDRYAATQGRSICYISDVYVAPSHRRRGIARKLFEIVFKKLDKGLYARVEWKTRKRNTKARALYKKLGSESDWIIYERFKRK